jgi:hypothetical protein
MNIFLSTLLGGALLIVDEVPVPADAADASAPADSAPADSSEPDGASASDALSDAGAADRPAAGLRLTPPGDPRLLPPALRLSFTAPGERGPMVASLLSAGPRQVELSRTESTLKGVHLAASTAAFLGAVSASYDLWDEKKTWWMIGGAAAAGALWGSTKGFEDSGWRTTVRFSED